MKIKYQLLVLGDKNKFSSRIENIFKEKILELGLDDTCVTIITSTDFHTYKSNTPSVCIYFGGTAPHANEDILSTLVNDSCTIIPIVDDIKQFSSLVPGILRPLNGFELNSTNESSKIPSLVSRILEGLSLLRKTRKLFISYRRVEARSIALQLYGHLDECGFNVFLDTHSIAPGAPFQDELWHSLADTDVLVLLNTQNFVGNKWTDAELAQASAMSVGITQLVWPNCDHKHYINQTSLATPVYLKDTDFKDKDYLGAKAALEEVMLKSIESDIESLRARALAARQDNLVKEFFKISARSKKKATLQPERNIIVPTKKGGEIAIIPTVGVPDVYTSYTKEKIIKDLHQKNISEAWILYDHRNILSEYLVFVNWLSPLPVKFVKITEIENQLKGI